CVTDQLNRRKRLLSKGLAHFLKVHECSSGADEGGKITAGSVSCSRRCCNGTNCVSRACSTPTTFSKSCSGISGAIPLAMSFQSRGIGTPVTSLQNLKALLFLDDHSPDAFKRAWETPGS